MAEYRVAQRGDMGKRMGVRAVKAKAVDTNEGNMIVEHGYPN